MTSILNQVRLIFKDINTFDLNSDLLDELQEVMIKFDPDRRISLISKKLSEITNIPTVLIDMTTEFLAVFRKDEIITHRNDTHFSLVPKITKSKIQNGDFIIRDEKRYLVLPDLRGMRTPHLLKEDVLPFQITNFIPFYNLRKLYPNYKLVYSRKSELHSILTSSGIKTGDEKLQVEIGKGDHDYNLSPLLISWCCQGGQDDLVIHEISSPHPLVNWIFNTEKETFTRSITCVITKCENKKIMKINQVIEL